MKKVLDVFEDGRRFVCKKNEDPYNPYRLYNKYYSCGWHEVLIDKYSDMTSVLLKVAELIQK